MVLSDFYKGYVLRVIGVTVLIIIISSGGRNSTFEGIGIRTLGGD